MGDVRERIRRYSIEFRQSGAADVARNLGLRCAVVITVEEKIELLQDINSILRPTMATLTNKENITLYGLLVYDA